ncbi:hypothetical protein DH2020_049324 [Rehmannia glutinosa]|uniref:Putative gamma-glutamylcyclotransferase n=1 Tax=Rehmannia glutinosa TaxID=99300 RepID=A0ABR0U385_REHGL
MEIADDVVRVLLNRVPPSLPSFLICHQRLRIKRRVYPAMIPAEDKKVTGKVLLGITPRELEILDAFEDVEYERRTVDVFLKDSSEKVEADTYVWVNKTDPDLYGEWDFEEWKMLHMKDFLKMTAGFMDQIKIPDLKTRVAMYESFYKGTDNNNLPNP